MRESLDQILFPQWLHASYILDRPVLGGHVGGNAYGRAKAAPFCIYLSDKAQSNHVLTCQ